MLIGVHKLGKQSLIIFDGDCGFCSLSVSKLSQLLGRRSPQAVPFQKLDLRDFELSTDKVMKAMYYSDSQGKMFSGADAFRIVFRDAGSGWIILYLLLSTPIIKQVARKIYRLIAVNRQKMPGSSNSCGMN